MIDAASSPSSLNTGTFLIVVTIWGDRFRNKQVHFHCNNMGVVVAFNLLLASSLPVVWFL